MNLWQEIKKYSKTVFNWFIDDLFHFSYCLKKRFFVLKHFYMALLLKYDVKYSKRVIGDEFRKTFVYFDFWCPNEPLHCALPFLGISRDSTYLYKESRYYLYLHQNCMIKKWNFSLAKRVPKRCHKMSRKSQEIHHIIHYFLSCLWHHGLNYFQKGNFNYFFPPTLLRENLFDIH
jgi:hypothetical protein